MFWKLRNKVFQEEGPDQLRERLLPAQEGKKAKWRRAEEWDQKFYWNGGIR